MNLIKLAIDTALKVTLIISIIYFAGCKSDDNSSCVKRVAAKITDAEQYINITPLLGKNYNLVVLDSADGESLIGDISSIRIDDKYIYTLDGAADKLYIFDMKGMLVNSLNKRGRAGDEYINITDFAISRDYIVILDHMSAKLMFYDKNNLSYKKSMPFFVSGECVAWGNELETVDDELFMINSSSETMHGYYNIYKVENEDFIPLLPFDQSRAKIGWSVDHLCNSTPSELTMAFPPLDTIYQFGGDGRISKYFVELGDSKIPLSEVYERESGALEYALENNYLQSIENVNKLGDYLTFRFRNSENSYAALYSINDDICRVGSLFVIEELGNFPVSDFFRADDYIISIISATSFQFLYSDQFIAVNKTTFADATCEQLIYSIRDKITEESNPVVLFTRINDAKR